MKNFKLSMLYCILWCILLIEKYKCQYLWSDAPVKKHPNSQKSQPNLGMSDASFRSSNQNGIQSSVNVVNKNGEMPILNGVCLVAGINPCVATAKCTPTAPIVGKAICICPSGYGGDGKKPELGGQGCVNIDECRSNLHDCDERTQECFDYQGGYECRCKSGFAPAPNKKVCLDIDECQQKGLNVCAEDSVCHNLEGSFRCDCKNPNQIHDSTTGACRDLDECTDMDGAMNPCEQLCFDRMNGVLCGCNAGYKLAADGRSCEDVDECSDSTLHTCDPTGVISKCVNTTPGYRCECNNDLGFQNASDNISCANLNECEEFPYICGGGQSCCKDLPPPQRFACTSATNLSARAPNQEGVSPSLSTVMSAIPTVMDNFQASAGANLGGIPAVLSSFAGNNQLFNMFSGFSVDDDSSEEIIEENRNLADTQLVTTQEVYIDHLPVIIANDKTPEELQYNLKNALLKLEQSYNDIAMLADNNAEDGYKMKGYEEGLFGGEVEYRNLQGLLGSLGNIGSIGSMFGNGILNRNGSGLVGNLISGRNLVCPVGFILGSELHRQKVRKTTVNAIRNAITNGGYSEDGTQQSIQPEAVAEGILSNTKNFADQISKWYTELSGLPRSFTDNNILIPPGSLQGGEGVFGEGAGGVLDKVISPEAALLAAVAGGGVGIGVGIGKKSKCLPGDVKCNRLGKGQKEAYK